jgi:hypothetical protein
MLNIEQNFRLYAGKSGLYVGTIHTSIAACY